MNSTDGGSRQGVIASSGPGTVSPHLPAAPLSRFEIKAGAIIPAALVTGLNSDLPGPVIAQVTEPVFDHLTGRRELIPQGARLIGRYDSQVGHGQDRVMVVWTRIVFPDGRSLDIGAMSAADVTGAGGLADQVDTHAPALARAVGLSTLVSIGGAAAQNSLARGSDNLVLQDAASGLAATASDTGRQIVERDLRRAPTLRVRPGWPLRLIVDKDLILPPAGA
ncbi:TrbI/VirB10 family protein [Phenylobacterium sp. LjRoot164]|uniref:TrbI/VirB10 family protein n=1 Tax=unclassified Phenylobacterium TaxID=2640670 RepID=UPI003ECD16D9